MFPGRRRLSLPTPSTSYSTGQRAKPGKRNAIHQVGVGKVTYDRWRQDYGGQKAKQAKRLKKLETENARLRKSVLELTFEKLILQGERILRHGSEHLGEREGKLLNPAHRRACIARREPQGAAGW